jgi:nitrogen fixation protein FixH
MSHLRKPCNPWPIAIVAYFAIFITFIVGFIVFATRQHVDLVRNDYYEEEVHFQQQLERIQRTREQGGSMALRYDKASQCVTLSLPAARAHEASGIIHFYRPSDATLDQEVQLALATDGTQQVDARKLRRGLWKVRVQCLMDGQEYFFDQALVVPPVHGS